MTAAAAAAAACDVHTYIYQLDATYSDVYWYSTTAIIVRDATIIRIT